MAKSLKTFVAFHADAEMARTMHRLHARVGIPISEQCRRALAEWLPKQDVGTKKATAKKGSRR